MMVEHSTYQKIKMKYYKTFTNKEKAKEYAKYLKVSKQFKSVHVKPKQKTKKDYTGKYFLDKTTWYELEVK